MTGLLNGKVAIVTGAAHGIGRGHAIELARHGAKVVVNDLGTSVNGIGKGPDADQVVELIEKAGGTAIADRGDVAHEAAVTALFDRAVGAFGRVDVVVNGPRRGRRSPAGSSIRHRGPGSPGTSASPVTRRRRPRSSG
jgi:NAD(P)-dependent dehydrogenase (short-subunit alcohol dehydrogenase family)